MNTIIGKKITLEGVNYYQPALLDNGLAYGYIFKDYNAFHNSPDDVCYIPEKGFDDVEVTMINGEEYYQEDDLSRYTRNDLVSMLGDREIEGEPISVEDFFGELVWAHPETYLFEIDY